MYLWKLISTFYKNYLEKPIVTSLLLDSTSPMTSPTVLKKQPIQKRDRLSKGTNKKGRNYNITPKFLK